MTESALIEALEGFIYAALTVTSLGVMGLNAETCDLDLFRRADSNESKCPGRIVAIIVLALIVFILSLPMFLAYVFKLSFLKRLEIFFVLCIVLLNIVVAALMTSRRTPLSGSFVTHLSWWGLLFAFAGFCLTLSTGERPKFEMAKKADPEAGAQPGATAQTPPAQTGAGN